MQVKASYDGSIFQLSGHLFLRFEADYYAPKQNGQPITYLVVSDLFHQRYGFPVILLCLAAEPWYKVGAYGNPGDNGSDVIHQVKVSLPRVTTPHALLPRKKKKNIQRKIVGNPSKDDGVRSASFCWKPETAERVCVRTTCSSTDGCIVYNTWHMGCVCALLLTIYSKEAPL